MTTLAPTPSASTPVRKTPSRPKKPITPGQFVGKVALYAFLTITATIVLVPLLGLFFTSLQPAGSVESGLRWPTDPQWENYANAWTKGRFSTLMANSLIVATFVVPVGVAVSVLAGYAFGTMRFRGSSVLFYLFMIGLIMPFEATIVPLYYQLRELGVINNLVGVMLPQVGLFSAFGIFWMRQFFRSSPPALVEAARIDGANSFRILRSVLLPISWPPILTLATLMFIWSWNEFILSLVVLTSPGTMTAPAGLGLFVGERISDVPGLSAGALIVCLPTIFLYVVLNRKIISGILQGAVKG
jgi:raffinose/stachyose/melibiose transport system permease protein